MAVDRAELRNRATWAEPSTVAELAAGTGWTDPGEAAAVLHAAPAVRGRPILDVGVGTGRTADLLRLLSDDYFAVDYTPEMVEAFRAAHPGLDVGLADARDLSEFGDGVFGLVVFSFAGIDAVPHHDRALVLREMHRVLQPGGVLVFSTHNLRGPGHREVPWRGPAFAAPMPYRIARFAARLPMRAPSYARSWWNWWRNRAACEEHDGWAMRTAAAHEFNLVIHYVDLDVQRAALADAGFDDVVVYGSEASVPLGAGASVDDVRWFHFVASRPLS